jgi:hypothetical protein
MFCWKDWSMSTEYRKPFSQYLCMSSKTVRKSVWHLVYVRSVDYCRHCSEVLSRTPPDLDVLQYCSHLALYALSLRQWLLVRLSCVFGHDKLDLQEVNRNYSTDVISVMEVNMCLIWWKLTSETCHCLRQGCTNAVAWSPRATICYTVALDVSIALDFFKITYINMYQYTCTEQNAPANRGSRVTPELWALSMILAACYPSGVYDLEVACRFFWKFVDPRFTYMYVCVPAIPE